MAEDPKLEEYWDDLKEGLRIPKMTDDQLRELVCAYVDRRIFTLHDIHPNSREHLAGMVFMPLALGAFAGYNEASLKKIGTIYEYLDKAGPRSINGYPIFFSLRIVHVKDWERALKAIQLEEERRKGIVLPPREEDDIPPPPPPKPVEPIDYDED